MEHHGRDRAWLHGGSQCDDRAQQLHGELHGDDRAQQMHGALQCGGRAQHLHGDLPGQARAHSMHGALPGHDRASMLNGDVFGRDRAQHGARDLSSHLHECGPARSCDLPRHGVGGGGAGNGRCPGRVMGQWNEGGNSMNTKGELPDLP